MSHFASGPSSHDCEGSGPRCTLSTRSIVGLHLRQLPPEPLYVSGPSTGQVSLLQSLGLETEILDSPVGESFSFCDHGQWNRPGSALLGRPTTLLTCKATREPMTMVPMGPVPDLGHITACWAHFSLL